MFSNHKLFSELSWVRGRFDCSVWPSAIYLQGILKPSESHAFSTLVSRCQCCMHTYESVQFWIFTQYSVVWFNVLPPSVIKRVCGQKDDDMRLVWARKRMDSTWCMSAAFSPWQICLFLLRTALLCSKATRTSMFALLENTKIKAIVERANCLSPRNRRKRKGSCLIHRSPTHSWCVFCGCEPTPRLFGTSFALLCDFT